MTPLVVSIVGAIASVLLIVVIGGMGTIYGAAIGSVLFLLAQSYLQDLLRVGSEAASSMPWLAALLSPDRWLLWLGLLFVLSVYYFPTGVVGRLRARAALGTRVWSYPQLVTAAVLVAAGVDPTARGESLTVGQFAAIAASETFEPPAAMASFRTSRMTAARVSSRAFDTVPAAIRGEIRYAGEVIVVDLKGCW